MRGSIAIPQPDADVSRCFGSLRFYGPWLLRYGVYMAWRTMGGADLGEIRLWGSQL